MSRGRQVLLRPQQDFAIARLLRKADTFTDKLPTDAQAPRIRLDEQQPQLRSGRILGDQEDAAETPTVALSDPTSRPGRLQLGDEVGRDPRHQSLEVLVPT